MLRKNRGLRRWWVILAAAFPVASFAQAADETVPPADSTQVAETTQLPEVVVQGRADDLLGRNTIGRLGILAHKVLSAAGHDVGLVTIGSEILQHLLHG